MSQLIKLIPTSGPGSGTVTSITFNGGLTSTPDPVTTTGTATIDQTNLTFLDGTVYWDTGTQLLNTTATGTAGQVLTSQGAGLPPVYAAAPGTTLTFDADSGSAVPAANTINFLGSSNITSAAAGSTVSYRLSGTTNHAVQVGNGTGSLTSIAVGATGQVLTGVTGSDPVWASPAASSISITGDSGGALTGNAFTFTGGTTGLTFAGAGTTETLGGTLAIANGGTNATSMATSTGIVKYDGTRLVTSSTAKIDSSNRMTNTSQPAFFAYIDSSPSNVTGDGTAYVLACNNVLYDNNSNYNNSTYTFTAPVTGIYIVSIGVLFLNTVTASTPTLQLAGTSPTLTYGNYAGLAHAGNFPMSVVWPRKMTAGDTFQAQVVVGGGSKTVGVYGGVGDARTWFSAYLAC
jgi:hypothetical protein